MVTVPLLASGCSFLIPENPSEARYNTVLGERRVPQENAKMTGGGASSMPVPSAPVQQQPMVQQMPAQELPPATPAPVPAPVTSIDLPPVDANTQRLAAERLQQQQDQMLAERMASSNAPQRSVPNENMQMAGGSYPDLRQVPPAPPRSGPNSDAARLDAVRQQLERDRAAATDTTRQVRDAAAAEPSMLGPNGTMPAPEPIMSAPVPSPQSFNAPSAPARGTVAPLPPPPPLAAAPAPMAKASATAPIQMDQLPMNTAPARAPMAMEPITLRPPVVAQPAPQFVPTPAPTAPTYSSMPPAAGSFDPMAGARTGMATANAGYLPASRYSSYRR